MQRERCTGIGTRKPTLGALTTYIATAADITTMADAIRAEIAKMNGCQDSLVLQKIKDALDLVNAACAPNSCRESLQ